MNTPLELYYRIFYISPTEWFTTFLYKNEKIGGAIQYLSNHQPEAYKLFQQYNSNQTLDAFSTKLKTYDEFLISFSKQLSKKDEKLVPLLNQSLLLRRRIDTYKFREKTLDDKLNQALVKLEKMYPNNPLYN